MIVFHLCILAEKIEYNRTYHPQDCFAYVEPIAVTPHTSTCLVWLRFNSSYLMDGSQTLASRFLLSPLHFHCEEKERGKKKESS
jgi:hypothetical protein